MTNENHHIARNISVSRPRNRQSRPSGKNDLPANIVRYFMDLDKQDWGSTFTKNWRALGEYNCPDTSTLSQILFTSAKVLMQRNKPKRRKMEKSAEFVRRNINLWENEALPKVSSFTPRQMVKSLWGYANFGLIPSKEFMDKFFECAEKKKDKFEFRDARMGLWSLARMGVIPRQDFIENSRKIIADNIDSLSASDIALVQWSLAVLDSIEPNARYKEIYDEFRNAKDMDKISVFEQKQMRDCDLWFCGETTLQNPFRTDNENYNGSKLENELKNAFKRASFKVEKPEQPLIPEFGQAIDFPVSDGKKTLWVEVDGPTHYMYRPSTKSVHYNGPTIFRSALIHKFAPDQQVLRIGYKRIGELLYSDFRVRKGACTKLFNIFTDKPPGVYGVNEPEQNRPTNIFVVAPRVPVNGNSAAAPPQVA